MRNRPRRGPAAAFGRRWAADFGFTLFFLRKLAHRAGLTSCRLADAAVARPAAPPGSEPTRRSQRERRVRPRQFPRQVRRRPGVTGLRTTKRRICGCPATLPRPNRACHTAERGEVALFGRCVLRQNGRQRREKADARATLLASLSCGNDERLGRAPIVRSGESRNREHNATSNDRGRVFGDYCVRSCVDGLGCSPWGWLEPSGR